MKNRLLLLLLVVLFTAVGCAQYSLVNSGDKVQVSDEIRVATRIPWSMAKNNGMIVWTVDGPGLEELIFFPGIEAGSPLVKQAGKDAGKTPVYKAGMTFIEVMDLLEATVAGMDVHQFEKSNLQPMLIGGQEGFRFDFSYVSEKGLEYRGLAAGVIRKDKLYLVTYTGTALHYYEKYAPEADYIINSIEFH